MSSGRGSSNAFSGSPSQSYNISKIAEVTYSFKFISIYCTLPIYKLYGGSQLRNPQTLQTCKPIRCKVNNFTCVNLETHTCFVLWITYFLHCNWYLFCTFNFSTLSNLFFFIVIDNCEEKLALWHIVTYDSVEWLFSDYFCLMIWYSTRSCLSYYYFCNEERGVYKPPFF